MKKKYFIFFLLIVNSFVFVAQDIEANRIIDSIKKHQGISDEKVATFSYKLINYARKKNNFEAEFVGYHRLLILANETENYDKTSQYVDTIFQLSLRSKLPLHQMKAYYFKSSDMISNSGYNNETILQNNLKALEIAKQNNLKVWECKFNGHIAEYYSYIEETEKAIEYYKKIELELLKVKDTDAYKKYKVWGASLENTYLSLTEIYLEKKQVNLAKKYNNKAKKVLENIKKGYYEMYLFYSYLNDIDINLLEKNTKKASESFKIAFNNIPDYYNKSSIQFLTLYYNSLIAFNQKNYKKTIQFFNELDAKRIEERERKGFYLEELYKMQYKSYLQLKDLDKADLYFDKYIASLDSKKKINNEIREKLKKIEINTFKKDTATLKKEQNLQLIILIAVSLISIFSLVIYMRKKQRKNKEKVALLLHKISEKSALTQTTVKAKKEVSLKLKDSEIKRIITNLKRLEQQEFFLKTDCTAANLAKELETNTTYLSKIINTHYQKSFTKYINELRVNYVLNRIKNDKLFRRYSIQSIANEIGFKSRESFNTVFKKETGILPSFYIKELNSNLNN
jgi:AraC-like DNA-binding protein